MRKCFKPAAPFKVEASKVKATEGEGLQGEGLWGVGLQGKALRCSENYVESSRTSLQIYLLLGLDFFLLGAWAWGLTKTQAKTQALGLGVTQAKHFDNLVWYSTLSLFK